MTDHKTKKWSVESHFVTHQLNNRYHAGIKNIPYALQYGQACRVGLSHMNLPENLLQKLEKEENLNSVLAEAQVLMAVTSAVAATGEEAAEEDTGEVNTAEPTEYISAIEAAIEAINEVDDPNTMLVTTTEMEAPTETESPTAPTKTQQPMETTEKAT
jgi:hypothetical protein